jgi:hypothetical protein
MTLTTIPALIMRAWTASADLGIVRMNQTTSAAPNAKVAIPKTIVIFIAKLLPIITICRSP